MDSEVYKRNNQTSFNIKISQFGEDYYRIQVMGCGSSVEEGEHTAHWKHDAVRFQAIGLSEKEIKLLFDPFKRVLVSKVNASGTILVSDLLPFLFKDQDDSPFMIRAFGLFASEEGHHTPRINFKQFVFGYWNLCTLSHKCLVRFAADLYNTEKDLEIPLDALKKCITEIHNKTKEINEKDCIVMEAVREKLDSYQHKPYHTEDFINFCHTFPTAMFPLYEMQDALQKFLFGPVVWTSHAQKRESQHRYKDLQSLYALCEPRKNNKVGNDDPNSSNAIENHTSSKHHGLKRGSVVPVASDSRLKDSGFVVPHAAHNAKSGRSENDRHQNDVHVGHSHKQHLQQESAAVALHSQSHSGHPSVLDDHHRPSVIPTIIHINSSHAAAHMNHNPSTKESSVSANHHHHQPQQQHQSGHGADHDADVHRTSMSGEKITIHNKSNDNQQSHKSHESHKRNSKHHA